VEPLNDPDVQLMLAVQAGNSAAFRALYRKYAPHVVRYAMQFVGSQARAEEIAQDVFLRIYRNRHRYKPEARLATFIFRVATNACLSELRRPEHRVDVQPLEAALADPQSDGIRPKELADRSALDGEAAAIGAELRARICRMLQGLPAQQRAALLLARMEGLGYEEVAAALNCSVSAVKSLIHRATATMRQGLRDYLRTSE